MESLVSDYKPWTQYLSISVVSTGGEMVKARFQGLKYIKEGKKNR
jgi:hypothetical protein